MDYNHPSSSRHAPPMKCLLCGAGDRFLCREHLVPESLGNNILILAPGWICDDCNNICSAFESRALSGSVLGAERCRLAVVTKKGRPARATLHGVEWFAEPTRGANVVSVEADWAGIPVILHRDGSGTLVFPMHDDSNVDVCRLLLKLGVELLGFLCHARGIQTDLSDARAFVLGLNTAPWPYFVLRVTEPPSSLLSVLSEDPETHEYVRGLGFDLFLHNIGSEQILVFQYGMFLGAAAVTSRNTGWTDVFREWGTPFVGCPIEFAGLHG